MPGDGGAVGARDVARGVARAVVHHQYLGLQATDLCRNAGQHLAEALLLVVGGNHDRDLVAEAIGQPIRAELLPGDSLEHGRELAIDARRSATASGA